jgi:cytochrome c556
MLQGHAFDRLLIIQEIRMRKTLTAITAVCVAAALLTSLPAAAQFAKPEDAVRYRKAAFTLMGAHMKRLGAMAEGKAPFDAKLAAENADVLAYVAKLPFDAFIAGSEGGRSEASPKVWSEPDKFQVAAKSFQDEATKLSAAAKTGNLDALKAAVGATGKSCKSCHDAYKKE